MTIDTTKDPRPDTTSDLANEPPITSKIPPGLSGPPANSEPDLESRITMRRAELIAKLGELMSDMRPEATEARDKLKVKLSELAHLLKWGLVDGWASLGDHVKHRLEHWLGDSDRHPPSQDGPAKIGQS